MDIEYAAKTSQEQAVASWVDYLNQIRIDRLISRLSAEQINLQNAEKTIHDTLDIIDKEIVSNDSHDAKNASYKQAAGERKWARNDAALIDA